MGRKIPGKKHKGVKDPLIQKAVREEKLKSKINAPPSDPDSQEIPKSLENIIRLKKIASDIKCNNGSKKRRRGNRLMDTSRLVTKEVQLPGMKRPVKTFPKMTQWLEESQESFIKRIDEAAQCLINEVEYEHKFGVHIRRNPNTGDVEEIEMANTKEFSFTSNRKNKNLAVKKALENKSKDGSDDAVVLNRKQRLKLKALKKKEEHILENEEKAKFIDHVKFGEVVHRPPVITVKPRNAPDKKSNFGANRLLLQNKLSSGAVSSRNKNINFPIPNDFKKRQQEELRKSVVELYRKTKLAKKNNFKK